MEKFWFLCFVPVFLMACLAMSTPTNFTTDQFALIQFKSRITFEPHNVLAHSWSTATSCCSWIGVTCGARHQRVVALNLSHMDLTGTIPLHLGNLSFLAELNIRNNSFHGYLPHELGFLHRLKVFDLGYNNFAGGVPLWLGILPKLEKLFLFNNNFSGTIPSAIFNISSLQMFVLNDNRLSGSLPVDMCNHLPELKFLNLHQNYFYGKIPSGIHKCRQLQTLSFSGNKFTGSIPREIGNLTMLQGLYLYDNNLEGLCFRFPASTRDSLALQFSYLLLETVECLKWWLTLKVKFPRHSRTLESALCNSVRRFGNKGRYDVCCPMMSAWDLHKAWPEADFKVNFILGVEMKGMVDWALVLVVGQMKGVDLVFLP